MSVLARAAAAVALLAALMPAQASGSGISAAGPQFAPWRHVLGAVREGGGYVRYLHPSALAASPDGVYVADAAQGELTRYDPLTDRAVAVPGARVDAQTRLATGADRSLLVLDPASRRIQRFDRQGRLQQAFRVGPELAAPVDIAADPGRGLVYVADRLFNRLVVYHPLGQAAVLVYPKVEGGQTLQGISALGIGADGIYLVESLRGRLVVFGPEGGMNYASPDRMLVDAVAIAVDRRGRAFVLDRGENSVKIFERGKLVGALGAGAAGVPGSRLAALSISEEWLYLGDAQNGTLQILRILPPAETR
ncbi:MAG: hypothetical protein HYU77_15345 [Betaproteobacteria bacterium]|nr:hypothetical protein [Betaproteobacteria bacterium]